jgi:hypothetical protein
LVISQRRSSTLKSKFSICGLQAEVATCAISGAVGTFAKGAPISEDCWAGEQLRHAAAN